MTPPEWIALALSAAAVGVSALAVRLSRPRHTVASVAREIVAGVEAGTVVVPGVVLCRHCGDPTMRDGGVCYACGHRPEPPAVVPVLNAAGERIGPAREARGG